MLAQWTSPDEMFKLAQHQPGSRFVERRVASAIFHKEALL